MSIHTFFNGSNDVFSCYPTSDVSKHVLPQRGYVKVTWRNTLPNISKYDDVRTCGKSATPGYYRDWRDIFVQFGEDVKMVGDYVMSRGDILVSPPVARMLGVHEKIYDYMYTLPGKFRVVYSPDIRYGTSLLVRVLGASIAMPITTHGSLMTGSTRIPVSLAWDQKSIVATTSYGDRISMDDAVIEVESTR